MFVAVDANNNRINVEDAVKGTQYFCPICKEKVEFHYGSIRQHHFKHWKNSECLDKWKHDMSEWHLAWQNHFPVDNQERTVKTDDEIHRADVLYGKTVVEFQHSKMSPEEFQERNNFYTKNGYKIVWLFDLREEVKNRKIGVSEEPGKYTWKYSFTTFSGFDICSSNISVFFQFYDNEDNHNACIKRLINRNTNEKLTKEFETNALGFYTADDFVQLIKYGYFEHVISRVPPINEKKEDISIPELKKYGYKCTCSVKNEGLDCYEIETIIRAEIKEHGAFIYEPKSLRVTPICSHGVYSVICIELWTYNDCSSSYGQTVKWISDIIKRCVPNCLDLKEASLFGRKIRDIFDNEPSLGKGLINIETGADVYVKKEHIYKNNVYGRLETNGKYPGSNYSIFRSENEEWIVKFSYSH